MSNNGYSVLAKYYDKFTLQDCDYVSWSQYLLRIAEKFGVKTIADLACGTGKMTELLVKSGLNVTAVDASSEMLSYAVTKCKALFIRQDMRRLQLMRPIDMAVCVNDGVNYISPSELSAFFKRVADNLKQGAPFVFDISSQYKLTHIIADNVFYVDGEDETLLWTNKLRNNFVKMDLTLFVKSGNNYERFDETHTQYIHTENNVTSALVQSGFDVAEITSDYGKTLSKTSQRLTFFAVKSK